MHSQITYPTYSNNYFAYQFTHLFNILQSILLFKKITSIILFINIFSDGNYTINVNIDGIALSPYDPSPFGTRRVYYCPLSSYSLYSVSTSILKESVNGVTLRDNDVTTHAKHRSSQADGLAMDSQGLLFYGLLQNNSIVYVNTSVPKTNSYDPYQKEVLLVQNDFDLQWPDTFAFDQEGYLYTVSNRLQRYPTNSYDWNEVNFRVARIFVGS